MYALFFSHKVCYCKFSKTNSTVGCCNLHCNLLYGHKLLWRGWFTLVELRRVTRGASRNDYCHEKSHATERTPRVIHCHGAEAQGFAWGGLAKTHSKPTAVRKWHTTVTSRERALTREKNPAERNTDNSYPWTNPQDLKTRPWLMPPKVLHTAARSRTGEFDFSRAGK